MNIHRKPLILGWAFLCLTLLYSMTALATSGDPVGKVLMATGMVSAKSADANRNLERRSDIYVGDIIDTGAQSQVQIRMTDGALITLGAGAEFAVKTYRFAEAGKKDEAVLSLVKGGLRTITGHLEKSGYRLETPVASLGIRGTIFDVYVAADGTTTIILRQGGINVTGEVGNTLKMDIANLATIISSDSAPSIPGAIPQAVLDYFNSILPTPLSGGSWKSYEGGFVFTLDLDPEDILTDPATGFPPPGTNSDGQLPFGSPPPIVHICPCEEDPESCYGDDLRIRRHGS